MGQIRDDEVQEGARATHIGEIKRRTKTDTQLRLEVLELFVETPSFCYARMSVCLYACVYVCVSSWRRKSGRLCKPAPEPTDEPDTSGGWGFQMVEGQRGRVKFGGTFARTWIDILQTSNI